MPSSSQSEPLASEEGLPLLVDDLEGDVRDIGNLEKVNTKDSGRSELLGLGLYALTSILGPLMATFAKLAEERGASIFLIILSRNFFILFVATAVVLCLRLPNPLGSRRGLLLLRGGLGGLSNALYFVGVTRLRLAEATFLSHISPLVTAAGASVWLGEPLRWHVGVATVLALIGVGVVSRPFGLFKIKGEGHTDPYGVLASLVHAVSNGLAKVALRALRSGDGDSTEPAHVPILYLSGVASACTLLVSVAGCSPGDWGRTFSGVSIAYLAGCGLVGYLLQVVMTAGLGKAKAGPATACSYLAIVWSSLFGYIVFGEVPTASVWVGGSLIVASVAGMTIFQHFESSRL